MFCFPFRTRVTFIRRMPALAFLLLATFAHAASAPGSVTLTADQASIQAGSVLHLVAHGAPGAGPVTFVDGAMSIASIPVDQTGMAALSVVTLARGPHQILATQSGLSSNSVTISVNGQAASLSMIATPASLFPGASFTVSASGLPADATGTVTFSESGSPLASAALPAPVPSYTTFGDSITAGAGLANPSLGYPALFASSTGLALNNLAIPGSSSCDVMTAAIMQKAAGPTQTASPLYSLMVGSNDLVGPAGVGPYQLCHQAAAAWLGTPREYKSLAGDASVTATAGTWTSHTTGPVDNTYRTLYNNTGAGSARVTITTSGGPVYLWYLLQNASPALFTVSLDGVPNGVTYGVQAPAILHTASGPTGSGFALLRLPATAGTHTLDITLLTGSLGILGAGTPPSPGGASIHPTVLLSDIPNGSQSCSTNNPADIQMYSDAALADAQLLLGDGLDIRFVTTRTAMLGTPAEMTDCVQPNALGAQELASVFAQAFAGSPLAAYGVGTATPPTGTASLQSVGTHNVIATYSGDGRYQPAISAAVPVTLNDPSTSLTLTGPHNLIPYRGTVVLTATITPADANGRLELHDLDSLDETNGLLQNGTSTITTGSLPGTHHYYAVYFGTDGHTNSQSAPFAVTIDGQISTASLSASSQHIVYGQALHLTASISNPTCNGVLNFVDSVTGILGWTWLIQGTGSIDVPIPGGQRSVYLSYGGDPVCDAEVSPAIAVTVDPLLPSMVVTPPASSTFGSPVPLHFDLLAYLNPAQPTAPATIDPTFNATSVFMGDSITAWWSLPIHNAGISGQTAEDMQARFNNDVLGHGYERVFILAGANDILHTQNSTDVIIATIASMAATAANAGIRPILCTLLPIFPGGVSQAARVDPLNAAIVALAAQKGYLVVDYHAALVNHPETQGDGVHPDYRGHDDMQTQIARTLFVPSGTVLLPDGSSATLSSTGTATLADLEPHAGSKSFNVVYNGDTSFLSEAVPVSFQINQAQTTLALNAQALTGYSGTTAALVAMLTNTSNQMPTGPITFYDGSTVIGTANLQPDGTAIFTSSSLTRGIHSFTASFHVTSDYTGSTSPAATISVVFASTTVALSAPANSFAYAAPVPLTAVVSPASAGGLMTFLDGNTVLGQATVANGIAAFTPAALDPGTHTFTAAYAGDTLDAPSESASLAVSITSATSTLTLASLPASSPYGTPLTLSASITPVTASGMVTFFDGTVAAGQTALVNGMASLQLPSLTAGLHTISARYAGDTGTQPSSSTRVIVTITPTATALTLAAPSTSMPFGSATTLTATLTPASVGGTITLTDGSTTTQGTLTQGIVTFPLASLGTGAHTYTATYAGDANDVAATSQPVTITITQDQSTISLASLPGTELIGSPVTLRASVNPPTATGSVLFRDATIGNLGQAPVSQGVATLTLSNLAAASYSITAIYSGDTNYTAATSSAVTTQVALNPTTLTLTNPATASFGADALLTATIVPATATGLLSFTDNGSSLGTVLLLNGVATLHTVSLAPGTHSLRVTYPGDLSDSPSTSIPTTLTITQNTTATSLTLAQTAVPAGAPVTVNLAVVSTLNLAPTGTVIVRSGTSVVATATLTHASANAAYATVTLDSLTLGLGSYRLTAYYSGDADHALSDSTASAATLTIVPTPTTTTLSLSAPVTAIQSTVTMSVAMTATSGIVPAGSVTFMTGSQAIATVPLTAGGTASAPFTASALGTLPVSAVYTPTSLFAASSAPVETLVVTPPLTVALALSDVTLTPGASAADAITLTPLSGFNGQVNITCKSPVAYLTCTATAPPTLAGATNVPLNIAVAANLDATSHPVLPLAGGLLLLLLPMAGRRRMQHLSRAAIVVFGLALAAALTGCGAQGGNFSTVPAGVQTLTLNTTAAGITVTSSITVQITR